MTDFCFMQSERYRMIVLIVLYQTDRTTLILAAAAYNFKRAMRVLLYLIKRISIELVNTRFILKYSF